MPGNEQYLPLKANPEEIHRKLVENYRVLEKVTPTDINQYSSLFFHNSVPYAFYDDPGFKPEFNPVLPHFAENLYDNMIETCRDSFACRYDYIVTLDPEFAKITKQEETFALKLANDAIKTGNFDQWVSLKSLTNIR